MRWTDSGGGSDYTPAPSGAHVGICVWVIDLGTRKKEYQGQSKLKREVVIGWELPGALMTEGEHAGKPYVVTRFYTQSLHEKASLRGDLESWRGRTFSPVELDGFDAKNILGKPCLVTVIHDKGKGRISNITQIPKGMPVPKQVTPAVYFSLDEFDQATFDGLSKGFKRMIEESPEYKQLRSRGSDNGAQDDAYGGQWQPGDPPAEEDAIPF